MENKFKVGDIVIFEREPTKDEWQGIGYYNHSMIIGQLYTITNVREGSNYKKGIYCLDILEENNYCSPSSVFSLSNPLKIELNKLKETILTKKIRVTKKERRQFERLCLKLELPMHEQGFLDLSNSLFGKESEAGILGSALIYFETDENTDIDFKDLIEPFKKFRNEIL